MRNTISVIWEKVRRKQDSLPKISSEALLTHTNSEMRRSQNAGSNPASPYLNNNNMRTMVTSDIHGAHKALKEVLELSKFDKENDKLICLGDVADGYPEIIECFEELMSIKNLVYIWGNHDMWMHEWMKDGDIQAYWYNQGGKATYNQYTSRNADYLFKHKNFLEENAVLYLVDDQNRVFVHGGFEYDKPIEETKEESTYYWDRDLWNASFMFRAMNKPMTDYKEIYIGHTATNTIRDPKAQRDYTKPVNNSNVWLMDQGCGFKGKLSLMDIDTKEVWQSQPTAVLYPNYHGRK